MSGASDASLLEQLLASGASCIGEVAIVSEADGTFALMHRDDRAARDLQLFTSAAEVARYDDARKYRPLKTAPNLRHGWKLHVSSSAELARAIDELYPARLAALSALRRNTLSTTAFRDTLARQTGMYRVAARISDRDADDLIGSFCRSDGGCLRTILWRRDAAGTIPSTKLPPNKFDLAYDQTARAEHAIPLLCQESCNLLVAAARAVVKRER